MIFRLFLYRSCYKYIDNKYDQESICGARFQSFGHIPRSVVAGSYEIDR